MKGTRSRRAGASCSGINSEIAERFPGRITIAEDLRNRAEITAGVEDGGAGFGAQWDSQFVHPIREVLIAPRDEARHMATVAHALTHHYNGDAFRRVIYTESHDEVANGKARIPHEIAPGDPSHLAAQKRSTLGAALMFTAPGIPMLFQGQEFLQGDWFQDTVPLDWDQSETFRGIVRLYRDLIRLRLNRSGVTRGLDRTRHRRASDRRGAQARRLPPLAGGRPGRRRRGGRELQPRAHAGSIAIGFPREGLGSSASTPTGAATARISAASKATTSKPRPWRATACLGLPRLPSVLTARSSSHRIERDAPRSSERLGGLSAGLVGVGLVPSHQSANGVRRSCVQGFRVVTAGTHLVLDRIQRIGLGDDRSRGLRDGLPQTANGAGDAVESAANDAADRRRQEVAAPAVS